MRYSGFTKLHRNPVDENGRPTVTTRRGRAFTKFELGLITTLVVFAAALATYTVIYIVQHRGAIRPAAVATLSCVAVLLLAVAYSVRQRIRRPNWFGGDVESRITTMPSTTAGKKWAILAPIPMSLSQTNMSEVTVGSKATYTPLVDSRLRPLMLTPPPPERFPEHEVGDILATRKKHGRWLKFWISKRARHEGRHEQRLISYGSERLSSEISELGDDKPSFDGRPVGLWRSVFELQGEEAAVAAAAITLEPSNEQTQIDSNTDVRIVVTKPEPTARGRAQSWVDLRLPSLQQQRSLGSSAIDGLRSNPVQLRRDPSVRQTKSSHALVTLTGTSSPSQEDLLTAAADNTVTVPPRSRSAEPRPDRARLGHDLAALQLHIDRAVANMDSNRRAMATTRTQTPPPPPLSQSSSSSARPLRRAKSPVLVSSMGRSGHDLRSAYQVGL
ncbi:hypothetical protein B0H66DRAFT_527810 [Apodospora peruviana]|uniref:Uncharacterized protein n=1 Tax=Apodospora peruviana TaxID=516989 RepID=A0AAE0MFL6_9PEZI|nr:hypothetical protein B0H66DRAFT_527810 [Apodospora peruviana]